MSGRRTLATSVRVIRQLRHDPRTIALMLVVPSLLITLLRYVYNGQIQIFDRVGPVLVALFPFTVMFVVTSVAMLRERASGTLERLLTTDMAKGDLLVGYALAFGLAAVIQVGLVMALAIGPLGLQIHGTVSILGLVALLDALLGTTLGLWLSAFANSEFQAVQFLPAFVLPQLLLCGVFAPRAQMLTLLRWLSDVMPLTYAVDAATRAAGSPVWSAQLGLDLLVVAGLVPASLGLGAFSLRRRTG